ncbi:tachykinin-like peptides receptor 86C [Exaiptasia diaphana]|uniref:G-protein coupled receptors family 1 profile domain-containing protein n=1 Tax=Exaiptasia diaphana TaxID=2652724 RepID=A0A913Y877_EXADI|nr:tachykinin-like peptides receptor 86C [Exaiptasia diaphana]
MKTPMNYLLVNLAVCDMLVGIFFMPRHLFFEHYQHPEGSLGDFLCKCLTFGILSWPASCASVYTLIAIAWERYNAIMKPHSVRFSIKKIKIAVVLCWVLAFLISLLDLIVVKYDPSIKSCDYKWMAPWAVKLDAAIWLFAVGCLPCLIMLALYGGVIRTLWCSKHKITDVSQRSLHKSRKRVTKAAVTVTVILFVCWMLNLLYYFITSYTPQTPSTNETLTTVAPVFYKISHVLLLLNSSVNPFVYAVQDSRFRRCMSKLLCRWRNTRRPSLPADKSTTQGEAL